MKVEDLMSKDVMTIRPHETANEAARLMWECDCGAVPVVDENRRVVGIVTDRDICMAAYTQGRPLYHIQVEAAMTRDPRTCSPDDPIDAAEAIMQQSQVRRLPVVDDYNTIVGILSLNDIAVRARRDVISRRKTIDPKAVIETLGAICERARSGDTAEITYETAGDGETLEPAAKEAAARKPRKPRSSIRPQA
jgi:CBS domain-containing protein